MKRTILFSLLQSLLLLLFAYTAVSKFLNLTAFEAVLRHTPYLSGGAAFLAIAIPLAELVIVLLLLFSKTRWWGFVGSGALLSLFTVYLATMLLSGEKLPCSCGGVISALGWGEHLVMNLVFVGMAVWGARVVRRQHSEHRTQEM